MRRQRVGRNPGASMAEAARAALDDAERAWELQVDAADDMTHRLRAVSAKLVRQIGRQRLPEAAHTAGQVLMLARLIEARLLSAVDQRAGAHRIAKPVLDMAPAPKK